MEKSQRGIIMGEYNSKAFKIKDLYDIYSERVEKYREEYEAEPYWNEGYDEDEDDRVTPEEYREKLFGSLKRGEKLILIRYQGEDEEVVVPDGLAGIYPYAFSKNTFVRKIVIPDSVTTIGEGAFRECTALEEIRLSGRMTSTSQYMCKDCTALTHIEIPDSVTRLAIYSFDGCTSLKEVKLSKNLQSIGWDAFARCTSLKTICLPEGLRELDQTVFYDSGLEEIYIPKNVNNISTGAFSSCPKLKKIEVDPKNRHYKSRDNCVFEGGDTLVIGRGDKFPADANVARVDGEAFDANPFIEELVLPSGVKHIGIAAFRKCKNLRRVVLPDTLESIGRCAFESCTSLEEAVIPSGVKKIDGLAFWGSGVKRVVIKHGVEVIEENAFGKCPDLQEIYIPSTVTKAISPIGYVKDFKDRPVKVYLEKSDEKFYESWLRYLEDFDVVYDFESDIFQ